MKKFLWLIISLFLLAIYFFVPQFKKQPEAENKVPTTQKEEVNTVPVELVSISIAPTKVVQGEPVLIVIHGLSSPSNMQSLTFDGESIPIFFDKNTIAGLVGIDFHKESGSYPVALTLSDGQVIRDTIEVGQRDVATSDFDIPEQLGGNTPEAEHTLTDSLAKDTAVINSVIATTGPEKLWDGEFRLPLDGVPTITDVYGYKRQTGSVNLSHQGTDFRAAEGTPVYSMNSGTVVFAGTFRNYGHSVIIDHGKGLMTFYMHLSETKVPEGTSVKKGDLIALSGNTGYSLGPHLHLSVRINGLTIDPMKFLELMGPK